MNFKESILTWKGFKKLKRARISVVIKACLRSLNAFYYLSVYLNGFPLPVSLWSGLVIFIKYLIKQR